MTQSASRKAPERGHLVKCRYNVIFDSEELENQMCIGLLIDREWGDSYWKVHILFPAIFHGKEVEGEESDMEPLDKVTLAEAIQALEREVSQCQQTISSLRKASQK